MPVLGGLPNFLTVLETSRTGQAYAAPSFSPPDGGAVTR